jgi:hypothetical protein
MPFFFASGGHLPRKRTWRYTLLQRTCATNRPF